MAKSQPIPESRLDAIAEDLSSRLVDDQGKPPSPDEVKQAVEDKARELADAPVQDFVPLLAEHAARDELLQHGVHPNLEPEAPPVEDGSPA